MIMSNVEEIESAIIKLSPEDKQTIRDWLDEQLEDELELSDQFKTKVERAKQEIAAGVYSRVRQPQGNE